MTIQLSNASANEVALERTRATEITRIATSHQLRELGERHIAAGTSLAEFRGLVMNHLRATGSLKRLEAPASAIGLTDQQASEFSLSRFLAGQLDPMRRAAAGFEFTACGEAQSSAQAHGYEARAGAWTLPYEVARRMAPWIDPEFALAQRVLTASGGVSSGGAVVETIVLAGQYIPPNYVQPRVVEAGAMVLSGLQGNIKVPKMSAGNAATWISSENTAVSPGDPTMAQVSLTPRDLGAVTDVSRRLILQSTPGIDNLVAKDLGLQLAIALDAAALNGTGASGQPQGLAGTSGVTLNPVGTNGGPLTWAIVTTNVQSVAAASLLGGSLGWITSGQGRLHCCRTPKVASYPEYLADAPAYNSMVGYPIYSSQNVLTNVTKGSGVSLTQLFFGAWDQLLLGVWGNGIDLLIDPYTFSNSGGVRIRALMTVDVAPRYAAGFAATLDVNPT